MFYQFLDQLGDLKEKQVQLKHVKKILKIQEKCFPRHIQNHYTEFTKHSLSKWQRKDKLFFIWTVLKYLEYNQREDIKPVIIFILFFHFFLFQTKSDDDWQNLGNILGVSHKLLNIKWMSMLKVTLKEAPWSQEEDNILLSIVKECKSWTNIALEFNRISPQLRHAKQIRERWNNYLDPELNKEQWSPEEQLQLLQLSLKVGKRWSQISKQIKGRTENQVKNAYNSLMNNYRRNQASGLEQEEEIVRKLIKKLEPCQPQSDPVTSMMSPLMQQQLFQAFLYDRMQMAYLNQFAFTPQPSQWNL